MFEVLRNYFNNKISLPDDQFEYMCTFFISKKLKKGEFLQRQGEPARYGAFVASGCMRSYIIDEKGKEHIVQFAPENWWISDLLGLSSGAPSRYFIDAIEKSDLLLLDFDSHKKLMEEVPEFARSFQSGIQKHITSKDTRIINSLSSSAEQRYQNFLGTYPSIAHRVPQHMLASYLGISPETLSRIRKQQAGKK